MVQASTGASTEVTIQRANPIDNPTDNQTGDQTSQSHREDLQAESVETGDTFQICLWIGLGTATALILIGWWMVKHSETKTKEKDE